MRLFPFMMQDKTKGKNQKVIMPESEGITFKDQLAPDLIEEHELYMELGRNFTSTFCIKDYKKRLYGNWLSELRRYQGNVSLSLHVNKSSSENMINDTKKAIPELESRTKVADEAKKRQAWIEMKDSERLLDKLLNSNDDSIFNVYLYIHLQARSRKELENLEKRVSNVLRKTKLSGTLTKYRAKDAFHSSLPLLKNDVPEVTKRNMDAEALSSFFPFDDSEIFIQSKWSVIKGINQTTGSVVLVDHFSLPSHSEFIAGATGMGKTTTLVSDILRHWVLGVRIFIVDPEGEFRPIINSCGGTVVVISNMSDTIINPLEIRGEVTDTQHLEDEKKLLGSLLHQKIQRLKILFGNIKKGLTQVEESLLEGVLLRAYEQKGITENTNLHTFTSKDFPTFSDLYEEMQNLPEAEAKKLEDFKIIFRTYVTGSHSKMFNGHTNVDLANDLICFDLKYLEDASDLKKSAMYNLITFLWDEITENKSQPKRLYIDECHVLADPDQPLLMKFVYQIYKRIRKYYGGATVATQQIDDYLSATDGKRNYGAAIIENSYTKLILGLENKGIHSLIYQAGIHLSDEEVAILQRKRKAQGIYCLGTKRVKMEVRQTQEEIRLFDPARYEKEYQQPAKEPPVYDISNIKQGVI